MENIDIKLVLLGEGEVGKTSLVNKFLGNEIPDRYLPTIGNAINHKEYILDNKKIRINVWDCGGQKAFNDFNPAVYNNVDGAFLVFDLSKLEKTIRNLKKEHFEHLEYYAEEEEKCILFFIGNKLDLILVNKDLESLKNNLSEEDLIIAISALTGENVNECFELLIYTVLKQTKRKEVAKEFIELIGKTEEQLINQLIDLASIDILLLKEKVKPKPPKIDTISAETEETEVGLYHNIQNEFNKIDFDRKSIFDKFYSTLSELEETLKYLRKSTNKSIKSSIDDFGEQLIVIGDEIESDLNYLTYLAKEENIVIDRLSEIAEIEVKADKPKIIAKKKEIKVKTKPKKEEPKEAKVEKKIVKEIKTSEPPGEIIVEKDLYQKFEKENPGKKAIWRGKETKGFLEWKKKYLGIISKDEKDKLYSEIAKSQILEVESDDDLDIISEKIKSDLVLITDDDKLNLIYEEENPGKKAIWRGKETKGFLEWKKNYI